MLFFLTMSGEETDDGNGDILRTCPVSCMATSSIIGVAHSAIHKCIGSLRVCTWPGALAMSRRDGRRGWHELLLKLLQLQLLHGRLAHCSRLLLYLLLLLRRRRRRRRRQGAGLSCGCRSQRRSVSCLPWQRRWCSGCLVDLHGLRLHSDRVVSPIEHLQGGRAPFLMKSKHNYVLCVYMISLHSGENGV